MAERPVGASHTDGRTDGSDRRHGRLEAGRVDEERARAGRPSWHRGDRCAPPARRGARVDRRSWRRDREDRDGGLRGAPMILGEVTTEGFLVHVPPSARARMHGADGLGRLVMGPETLALREGDKTVVVLGAVQIRARVVPVETLRTASHRTRSAGSPPWARRISPRWRSARGSPRPGRPRTSRAGALQHAVRSVDLRGGRGRRALRWWSSVRVDPVVERR